MTAAATGDSAIDTRPFRAGGLQFVVTVPDQDVRRLVEELFDDLPAPEREDQRQQFMQIVVTESRVDAPEERRFDLHAPTIGAMQALSLSAMITMLVAAVNVSVLDAETDRLHLHAAAAVRSGKAALLSGRSQTGKSTTVVHLVQQGWDLISDESVSISRDDVLIRGFPKPLSVKPTGRHLVPDVMPAALPRKGASHLDAVHVPLGRVGGVLREFAEPHLVALLSRTRENAASAEPVCAPIDTADAIVHLMTETFDAGRFGPDAVIHLARLASRCHCYRVDLGSPERTATAITELFSAPPVPPTTVTSLGSGGRVRRNVVSLLVGDRVVIHEQPAGRVVALDRIGSEVWLTLRGIPGADPVDLSRPQFAAFVDQLAGMGFIDGAEARDED